MEERLGKAVEENVAWCDRVARAEGITTFRDELRWCAATRPPPRHPDVITTRPGLSGEAALAGIDAGPGCSVKDSFADVDLAPFGFVVLFDARWVHRAAGPPDEANPGWVEERWPELSDPAVTLLRTDGGEAVLHDTGGVVGVSNADPVDDVWQAVVTRAGARELVGYEADAGLEVSARHGFVDVGPLRVWVRPD